MRWWLDIEELDGDKAGPGPLQSAISFEITRRLDAAGKFKAKAAVDARSAMVQPKRRARAWGMIEGTVTDLGAGIIDQIGIDKDLTLDLAGDDLLRELTYHQVGRLLIGASHAPSTTGPAQIAALFPSGWSLDTVNGYNATIKAIHHRFEGESCLAALCKLAQLTGEHFRLGVGRTVIWMQNDLVSSGIRAVQGGDPIRLEGNPNVCVVTELHEDLDSYDCLVGRVYAYGTGDGSARITLSGTTISHTGWTVGSDAKGYYLEHTATWNTYGIERYMSFKDVSDSDTLLEQAYEWMVKRFSQQKAYKLNVAKLEREIAVGSTMRVVYKRVLDGVWVLDIDDDLVVLESTTKLDGTGLRTVALKVATVAVWPDNAASAVSSSLNTSQDFYTHPQGFSNTTDMWDVIANAFGEIILYDSGNICQFFPATAAGLAAANTAAGSGDTLYFPACDITLAATTTIASGVNWIGQDRNTVLRGSVIVVGTLERVELIGYITAGGGWVHHCVILGGASGNAITPDSGMWITDSIVINGCNTGNGIAIRTGGGASNVYIENVYIGTSVTPIVNYGIFVNDASAVIRNLVTLGCSTGADIRVAALLEGCYFQGTYSGANVSGGIMNHCTFSGGTWDLSISTSSGPTLNGCDFVHSLVDHWEWIFYGSGDRAPRVHNTQHESGGADAIKLDDLAAPDNNTDLNATSGHHGLLPVLSGSSGDVLLGDGTWGGGVPSTLNVQEQDGTPSVSGVSTIKVTNGTLTDEGSGVVSLAIGGGSGSQVWPTNAFLFFSQFKKVSGSWTSLVSAASTTFQTAGSGLDPFNAIWFQDIAANGDAASADVLLEAGSYNYRIFGRAQFNLAITDWAIDGIDFATGLDWYANPAVFGKEFSGSVSIATSGLHTVKVTINGKSGSDYYVEITGIQFVKQ